MSFIRTSVLLLAAALSSRAQERTLTLVVSLPDSLDEPSLTVFAAGNRPEFGNWHPATAALERGNGTVWRRSWTFPQGSVLQFKVTAGSWDDEAVYRADAVPGNTIIHLDSDTTVQLRPIFWKSRLKLAKPERAIVGTVRYHRALTGAGLAHARDLIVWLPPSYETAPTKRYPVLYVHDGQNIFDPSTSFTGHDWRMDETADSLIRMERMEEVIMVGIGNTPDRLPEYSDSPLGDAYREFVISTVKPLMDSTYRTKPDRRHTAIMGSSLGGLCSFLFAWKRPDIFGAAAGLSTSFWYDDERTLKEIRGYTGAKKAVRWYLDCGGRERELLSGYRRMTEILKKQGYSKGTDLEYHLDANGVHNELSWSRRTWRPLLFLYGKK